MNSIKIISRFSYDEFQFLWLQIEKFYLHVMLAVMIISWKEIRAGCEGHKFLAHDSHFHNSQINIPGKISRRFIQSNMKAQQWEGSQGMETNFHSNFNFSPTSHSHVNNWSHICTKLISMNFYAWFIAKAIFLPHSRREIRPKIEKLRWGRLMLRSAGKNFTFRIEAITSHGDGFENGHFYLFSYFSPRTLTLTRLHTLN